MDKNHDAFEQAIITQSSASPEYPVNNGAEKVLNTVATSFLVFGWLSGILIIIVGIYSANELSFSEPNWAIIAGGIVFGIAQIAVGYLAWATLKVIVNISNNLYNINASLNKRSNRETTINDK